MVDQNGINEILEQLKNGELAEYYVTNEDFLPFREVLVKRPDFKHFRGIAQRGGGVIYGYTEEPRS
ncbi:hypothetical protein [Bacillus sp. B-jedd]|uniref:hypothetical protein n=1 Tax=Bacillus sp. B-jedd TaxID=1476857 RepID=UPI0005157300|nr:hypothetical protein [Bacillus sp. B-jedd]CEG26624.1 Hypothetical protein BN1002_01474 [Bacillus sp. B-jedd]